DYVSTRCEAAFADRHDEHMEPKYGLIMSERIATAARQARSRTVARAPAGTLALSSSVKQAGKAGRKTVEAVGGVPHWFGAEAGLELWPYQRSGAIAMAAGHLLLADETGLGKPLAALAALAITGTRRFLIVSPPVAMTHWQREVQRSGLLQNLTDATEKTHCP